MSNDLEVTVEPLKISVSYRKAQSDGNYGSDEVFASVQQGIPDNATAEQVIAAVAAIAAPLKEAVLAALPAPAAPKAQSKPASGGQQRSNDGAVPIVSWSPSANSYVAADQGPLANKLPADLSWIQAAVQDRNVKEVHFAEKRDKSGTYFQARTFDGDKFYLNEPETSGPAEDPTEEPF